MQNKTPSFLWAIPLGFLYPVLQVLIFYLRFGRLNQDSAFTDYASFFLSGALGAVLFIYFLRRSEEKPIRSLVMSGYAISLPLALFAMILGGLFGIIGVVIFGALPSLILVPIGYFGGKLMVKQL